MFASKTASLEESKPLLDALWKQLEKGGPYFWSPTLSPLFPAEWPPEAGMVWVRYAYAYGRDLTLADASRVSRPWARIEILADRQTVTIVPTAERIEAWEIQGVVPLARDLQAVLAKGEQVQNFCLGLAALPDPTARETMIAREFYRTWFKLNGAIARAIAPRHVEFIVDWMGVSR